MRRREAFLGEGVAVGLVIADVVEIRIRADLVERAAQEQLVGRHAAQIERARRQQKDLVGRGGQVVLAIAAVLEIGVQRFTGLLEFEQGVANLLHLAPVGRVEAGRLQQHRANAHVCLRLAQAVDDGADGGRSAAAQEADDVGGFDLGEIAAEPQHEERVARDGGLAPEHGVEQREAGQRHHEGDAEHGEDDGESAAGHETSIAAFRREEWAVPTRAAPWRDSVSGRNLQRQRNSVHGGGRLVEKATGGGASGWRCGILGVLACGDFLASLRPTVCVALGWRATCGSGGTADALASGASWSNPVGVQIPASAPIKSTTYGAPPGSLSGLSASAMSGLLSGLFFPRSAVSGIWARALAGDSDAESCVTARRFKPHKPGLKTAPPHRHHAAHRTPHQGLDCT